MKLHSPKAMVFGLLLLSAITLSTSTAQVSAQETGAIIVYVETQGGDASFSFSGSPSPLQNFTLLGGLLAIIGAGFVVPNTIATMLSQTNIFQFSPADMSWYVALIVASTIVAILVAWLWVKRMGLLPKKQEGESLIAETEK